jgi:nitrite reductase/ring-hydroxylating ferredoxin subunit
MKYQKSERAITPSKNGPIKLLIVFWLGSYRKTVPEEKTIVCLIHKISFCCASGNFVFF